MGANYKWPLLALLPNFRPSAIIQGNENFNSNRSGCSLGRTDSGCISSGTKRSQRSVPCAVDSTDELSGRRTGHRGKSFRDKRSRHDRGRLVKKDRNGGLVEWTVMVGEYPPVKGVNSNLSQKLTPLT